MWKRLLDIAKQVILLTDKTERNSEDIKELQQQIKNLTSVVERLAYEIRHVGDKDATEREKIILKLENELLRFERRLIAGRAADDRGDRTDG